MHACGVTAVERVNKNATQNGAREEESWKFLTMQCLKEQFGAGAQRCKLHPQAPKGWLGVVY